MNTTIIPTTGGAGSPTTSGASTDPHICAAFANAHPWTTKYNEGIQKLGGSKPDIVAVVPFGVSHAEVLSGYPSKKPVRGIVLAKTNIGGFEQVAFIRGDCATVIIVIREEGSDIEYTIGVRQARPAVGRSNLLETIAGMVDLTSEKFILPAGAVFETIQKEVLEETGGVLKLDPAKFINLSAWQHEHRMTLTSVRPGDEITKATPLSPGGSDEHVHIFACPVTLPSGSLKSIDGSVGGLAKEGERTLVQVMTMDNALFTFADAKFLASHALWSLWKKYNAGL